MKNRQTHLFSFLIIVTFTIIAFGSSDEDTTVELSKMLAYSFAEDFIKQRLKSPSTAKFPGIFEKEDHIIDFGNGQYFITSWVDSQNGFGAMIRSNWSCTIIFEDGKVQGKNIRIE
jgi:hypothetical protein